MDRNLRGDGRSVEFLNLEMMNSIDRSDFRDRRPFPWANPQQFVTADGWRELIANLPDPAKFDVFKGKVRKHGQLSSDRLVLDWQEGLALPDPWRIFLEELRSETYARFVGELFGHKHFGFRFHWHYTPGGSTVPPHCDSKGKLGSHIFYLNTEDDWQWEWGGETLILDDGGRIPTESSPGFEDFDQFWAADTRDNRSLIFGRRGNSWHGVRTLSCPEGAMRKVFIIVYEDTRLIRRVRKNATRMFRGKPLVPLRDPDVWHPNLS
jgi:hypothetical protein